MPVSANAEKAAERHHNVGDPSGHLVDHQAFDRPDMRAVPVINAGAFHPAAVDQWIGRELRRPAMKAALGPDLCRRARAGGFFEAAPAGFHVGFATLRNVHGPALGEDRLSVLVPVSLDSGHDDRAAPAQRFGIDMGLLIVDAGAHEQPDEAACSRAGCDSGSRGRKPSGRNHRPKARNGDHTEAGEEPRAAAEGSAYGRARAGSGDGIVRRSEGNDMRIAGSIRNDADVPVGDAGILEPPDCRRGIVVVIEKSR